MESREEYINRVFEEENSKCEQCGCELPGLAVINEWIEDDAEEVEPGFCSEECMCEYYEEHGQ